MTGADGCETPRSCLRGGVGRLPLYFFNVDDGDSDLDSEGTELKNLAVAKCEAVKLAGRIICDAGDTFWDRAEWRLTVTDEKGLSLFELYILGTESPAIQDIHPEAVRA
jgi:hypothetical protein